MIKNNHHDAWEKFLDPNVMQDRLISSAILIAAFDSLKESIVGRVKEFYQVGFGIEGDTLDPKYASQVLYRNSSPLYASLDWLKERGAITDQDIDAFNEVKKCRNKLAHSLLTMIAKDAMPDLQSSFEILIALLKKVEVWWIVNVEIPTNPDFDGTEEIDEEGIIPGPCMCMQIMMDVATGKSDYLREYRKHHGNDEQ